MIKTKDLTLAYLDTESKLATENPVLSRVNVQVDAGEFVLVCGPTGSGKSSLLKALNGLAPHFTGGILTGELWIDGKDVTGREPHDLAELVGYVNQQPEGSFVADTVIDEIAYGPEQLGIAPDVIAARIEELAARLGITDLLESPLANLSGGQQQRVAIASALASGQKILLLDEPTSALDIVSAHEVVQLLRNLSQSFGITVLLAEHRIGRVVGEVDSVLVVHGDGSVNKTAPGLAFNDDRFAPPIIELGLAMGWKPLPVAMSRAAELWATSPAEFVPIQRKALAGEVLLRAQNVAVRFGALDAVLPTSLEIRAGEIVALMGENGSGKTSLLWALQGSGDITSGLVEIRAASGESFDTKKLKNIDRLAAINMVPQRAADLLFLNTVSEELAESDRFAGVAEGTTAALLSSIAGRLNPSAHPRDLSAGQQLALVLAVQLAKGARVLLLDEPTRGLDYSSKRKLAKQLQILREQGRGVLVASHDIEFVAMVADRVLRMQSGAVVEADLPEAIVGAGAELASQLAEISGSPGLITISQVVSR
jgi:energy-coupling factor transport system ATP-binding protein